MPYALESMLQIRITREDKASTELTKARRAEILAQQERDKKQEELNDFNKTKEQRRDRIYETVIGRVVSIDTLDRTRDAVTAIDEEGLLLDEAKRQAQQALDKKTEEKDAAKLQYVAATKNKMKIEQHKAAWMEEDRVEQERLEDAEMEEFTGKKNDIED